MLLNHSGGRARGEEEEEGSYIEKTKGWGKNLLLGFGNLYRFGEFLCLFSKPKPSK